jgi:fatty-acyl-CoA synthase
MLHALTSLANPWRVFDAVPKPAAAASARSGMRLIDRLAADMAGLRGGLRALRMTTPIARHPTRIFPSVIEELADRFGDAPALLSDRQSLSYRQLSALSNRYARWALAQGVAKGETLCLLMPNRPEYLALWLGLTRIGAVVALLNTNLTGPALAYCINVVKPTHIIVAGELLAALKSAQPHLVTNARTWLHGQVDAELPRLDRQLENFSGQALSRNERPSLTIEDRALFIYTSGTTGLPKAANLNHYRVMLAACAFAGIMDVRATDRMYDCLPMYHTVGGVVATGAVLLRGGSVVIREKFSAHEFWDDLVRWDCTLLQYIGELCRYLVNAPPHPMEQSHRLRLACGNGLRPDVWAPFRDRFRIPQIVEFYGATEGNVTLFNFDGKDGAVGRIPWFFAHRFPTKVVRFDVEREQPIRDENGFCVECRPNEAGEVIGRILRDPSKPGARFEGYANESDSEKKVLHDVFEKGDVWFRTGDLMRKDENGYFYFVDRIGDTFRWKGENVSTTEVEEAIRSFNGVLEANVYGVRVPAHDGRAGMAAIVTRDDFNLGVFYQYLTDRLPEYARPLFVRICRELEVTGTFKQKKIDFAKQGFDPSDTEDSIYFADPSAKAFVRIDRELYERMGSGTIRL